MAILTKLTTKDENKAKERRSHDRIHLQTQIALDIFGDANTGYKFANHIRFYGSIHMQTLDAFLLACGHFCADSELPEKTNIGSTWKEHELWSFLAI